MLNVLWLVPQTPMGLAYGAPPPDLALSAESYHFSNHAGAY